MVSVHITQLIHPNQFYIHKQNQFGNNIFQIYGIIKFDIILRYNNLSNYDREFEIIKQKHTHA